MPMDLGARIKMINLQNKMSQSHEAEEREQQSEEELISAVEQVWEAKQEEAQTTVAESQTTVASDVPTPIVDTDLYSELKHIREILEEHTDTLKKINKHINATQKALKKGAK